MNTKIDFYRFTSNFPKKENKKEKTGLWQYSCLSTVYEYDSKI